MGTHYFRISQGQSHAILRVEADTEQEAFEKARRAEFPRPIEASEEKPKNVKPQNLYKDFYQKKMRQRR